MLCSPCHSPLSSQHDLLNHKSNRATPSLTSLPWLPIALGIKANPRASMIKPSITWPLTWSLQVHFLPNLAPYSLPRFSPPSNDMEFSFSSFGSELSAPWSPSLVPSLMLHASRALSHRSSPGSFLLILLYLISIILSGRTSGSFGQG